MVRATAGLGPIFQGLFAKWFDLLVPRLEAQGGAASGMLTLDDGTTVTLTGSHSSGSYQLAGDGGYSVTASVSGSDLSGTVTTPRGTGTVAPISIPTSGSPPADPTGVYSGTYQINVTGYFTNHTVATGIFDRKCGFNVVASGTLTLTVLPVDPSDRSGRIIHLADDWREANRIVAPCPGVPDFSEQVVRPRGPAGLTSFGDVAAITVGGVDAGDHDGGHGVRTWAFFGSMNGATIVARFRRSSTFASLVLNGTNEHREGYPITETTVTLTKR